MGASLEGRPYRNLGITEVSRELSDAPVWDKYLFSHIFRIFTASFVLERQCKDIPMFQDLQLFLSNIEIIFQKSI